MTKTNLVLMRHGQSLTNSGMPVHDEHQNILTARGIRENLRLATMFRSVFPDLHFDYAFCSPLPRALQTNYNFLSTVENNAVTTQVDERFIERSLGFDGYLTINEMISRYGQATINSWELDLDAIPGDSRGESLRAVYNRVIAAYEELVVPRLADGQTILITAHYYVLKVLQSRIQYGDATKSPLFDPRNSLPVPYQIVI